MKLDELAKLTAKDEEGVTGTIYQRDGDPYLAADGTESTFTVVGAESKRYRDAKLAHQRKMFKRARSGRTITPEEANLDAQRLAAAAVIAWHGWEDGTKALECTRDNVLKVLAYDHIFDQVGAMIQGHAVFSDSGSGS